MDIKYYNTRMEIRYSFKNFTDAEKQMFEEYCVKKLPSLEHMVTRYAQPPHTLEIRAEKFVKKHAFCVTLHLTTPRGTLMSSEDDHTIIEAIDLAKDKLGYQLNKK